MSPSAKKTGTCAMRAPRISQFPDRIMFFLIVTVSLAWSWELFQRFPFMETTITKVAGLLVIAGTLLLSLVKREWRIRRTGIEWPIAIFALACMLSVTHSLDRQASLNHLRIYGTYLLFFYAMSAWVRRVDDALLLLKVFILSATAVAAVSVACKLELLVPTYWRPVTLTWGLRLIEEARSGTPMRIAAVSADLNQGAFPLLLACAASFFIFDLSAVRRVTRWCIHGMHLLLLAGIWTAQSRSSLLVIALLVLALGAGQIRSTRKKSALVAVTLLLAAMLCIFGWGAFKMATVRNDSSIKSRVRTYRAGVSLLPRYGAQGTGLGASDKAIADTELGALAGGQTIHNVPLKIALETGLLGIAGYSWLWFAIVSRLRRHLLGAEDKRARRLGRATLAMAFSVFFVSLTQPFAALSIYPFLLALAFGPVARFRTGDEDAEADAKSASRTVPLVMSLVVVGAIIFTNAAIYQIAAKRVEKFGDALAPAPVHERQGNLRLAMDAYKEALAIASPVAKRASKNATSLPFADESLASLPYFPAMARVFDLNRVYEDMNLGKKGPRPQAVCEYGVGRVLLNTGRYEEAAEHLGQALTQEPDFAEAHFSLAECFWAYGRFAMATDHYRKAAAAEKGPSNELYHERMRKLDKRIEALTTQQNADDKGPLEHAYLLRKRGHWEHALEIYKRVAAAWPDSAEALFHLGVNEEIQGNASEARHLYERAVSTTPHHFEAVRRLTTLGK